jgi:hypothetical protein
MREVEVAVKTFDDGSPPVISQGGDTRTAQVVYTHSSDYEGGVPQMYDIVIPLTDDESEVYEQSVIQTDVGVTGYPMNQVIRSQIRQV